MFLYFGPDECSTRAEIDPINAENDQAVAIAFAVSRRACVRLFAVLPPLDGRWHMPHELRALRQSLIAITNDDEASQLLLSARSIELLCAFFAAFSNNQLVQANGSTTLREEEIALVVAAHKIVSENWHERLTVCGIARRCGMSRSKLTRGYREIYCTTIGEAVIERRLDGARRLLAESDLHISTVGYRCGYTNNASFSRAFTRRFGMTPSTMRRRERSVLGSMPTLAGDS
jgi:AraC family transcriptional activator of pyochelin receptor